MTLPLGDAYGYQPTSLDRAVDKAIAQANAAALNDPQQAYSGPVLYPEGTPEYEAYFEELRKELAKFAAGEGEYAELGF